MTPLMIMLAVQVIVSVALIVWTRARVRGFLGSNEELDRIRREIGALVIELDASADRNVTVVEDRLTALKDLVREADKRIAVLGQERGRRQPEPAVYDRSGRLAEQRLDQQPSLQPGFQPQPAQSEAPLQESQAAQRQAQTPPRNPPPPQTQSQLQPPTQRREQPVEASVPFIRFSDKPLPIEEPFADKVVSLYRRGFSSDIIAARLGVTMAEVNLVIELERERGGQTKE